MIVHQDPGMAGHVVMFYRFSQNTDKNAPVGVIQHNLPALISTGGDVINSAFIMDPFGPWHTSYLKELCRYVVLNPVRARMVKSPGEWKMEA